MQRRMGGLAGRRTGVASINGRYAVMRRGSLAAYARASTAYPKLEREGLSSRNEKDFGDPTLEARSKNRAFATPAVADHAVGQRQIDVGACRERRHSPPLGSRRS